MLDRAKYVFHPGSGFGNAFVAPFLAFGQRFTPMAFALDLVAVALCFEPLFSLLGRVAPVSVDVHAGVVRIEYRFKVFAVVRAGRARHDAPDHFVSDVTQPPLLGLPHDKT